MTRLVWVVPMLIMALVLGCSAFKIKTTGVPRGPSARSGETIVTMITRLEPYVPTLNRSGGDDRHTVGLLIHSARDSAVRRFIPIVTGQSSSSLNLVKITAADHDLVWFNAPEPGGYDVKAGKLFDPDQAGQRPTPGLSDASASLPNLATALRRLADDGFQIVDRSGSNRGNTIVLTRVDPAGREVWRLDTGIGELQEVLPHPQFPALIGERPRIPDQLPEPILVIADAAGRLTTHSLWLR